MKSLICGLCMAVTAISTGIYGNTEGSGKKFRLFNTYYQFYQGIYIASEPVGFCYLPSYNYCSITYLLNPGMQYFTLETQPPGIYFYSQDKALWDE